MMAVVVMLRMIYYCTALRHQSMSKYKRTQIRSSDGLEYTEFRVLDCPIEIWEQICNGGAIYSSLFFDSRYKSAYIMAR